MTDAQAFNLLFGGGNYAYNYLVKFTLGDDVIRICNNNKDIVYKDETYTASTFNYTSPDLDNSGGSLEFSLIDNVDLFGLIENTTDNYVMEVIGVINQDGNVDKFESNIHMYGSVSADFNGNMSFTLDKDDRLDMQFCVYKFDTENNPANA